MQVVAANPSHSSAYLRYVKQCHDAGLGYYHDTIDDPDAFLQQLILNSRGQALPEGWVPCTTFFCVADGEILGSLRLRHQSNSFIEEVIGHIGYDTKPAARGKGVASCLLAYVKNHLLTEPVLLFCDSDNLASQAVMLKQGAVLLSRQPTEKTDIDLLKFELQP